MGQTVRGTPFTENAHGEPNHYECENPIPYAETAACRMSDSISERKITKPSAEPIGASTARSGCGIRPSTLRSRLHTPAMFASEPFGFPAASFLPSGVV